MSCLSHFLCLPQFIAGCCFLVGLAATPGTASAGDDAKSPAPTKWILPPHYDKLDLSDDQKARVTRIAEVYNPKINNLKRTIDEIRKGPVVGSALLTLSVTYRKLVNDRQRLLNDVLTEKQREKYRELSMSK